MGYSQAEKVRNHERILEAAAAQIRDGGLESISVAKLMRTVGLTHGGFYGHFASRSDLLAQALARALAEGAARASGEAEDFAAFAKSYLSRAHRDAPKEGCAIAALINDVGRADLASREAMSGFVEAYFERARKGLPGMDDETAMAAVCTMVGAVSLARVMADPERSDQVLMAARRQVLALIAAADPETGADAD